MNDRALLIVTRKRASWISAVLILLLFFVFATGYYLGKRNRSLELAGCRVSLPVGKQEFRMPAHQEVPTVTSVRHEVAEPAALHDADVHYRAKLIGYGTKKRAQQFVDRLRSHTIETVLKTRVSTTSKGKKVTWYQVVTQPYTDRDELEDLVRRIRKLEHIRNPIIVTDKQ